MTGHFVLVLVAGLALGDNDSLPVAEMTRTKVDFGGHWNGEYRYKLRAPRRLELRENILNVEGGQVGDMQCALETDGMRHVVVRVRGEVKEHRGRYRMEAARLLLFFSLDSEKPPTSLVPGDSIEVWVLRRVR